MTQQLGKPLPQFNPHTIFHNFYTNPAIQQLEKQKMWTVASKEKIPHNIKAIHTSQGRIFPYATAHDNTQMMTLNDVTNILPHAVHVTAWLDAPVQGYFCIDIEKTCPNDLAHALINGWAKESGWHYAELSASGQGYHLILPVPENFNTHTLRDIKVIKHPSTFFEVLFTHWTVFTRIAYDPSRHAPHIIERPKAAKNNLTQQEMETFTTTKTIESFLDHMTQYANLRPVRANISLPQGKTATRTPTGRTLHIDTSNMLKKIPGASQTIEEPYTIYNKTPQDFSNDMSKWEYGYLCHLAKQAQSNLSLHAPTHNHTPEEQTIVLYNLAKIYLPHRNKHDHARGTTTWLMKQCASVVANTNKIHK